MYDLTIRLQTDGGKCLYQQIYEYIRQEIKEGKLLAGERLPSTRSLAEYLQISRSTVDTAYDQLLSEGYIESRPYRGYYVCSIEDIFSIDGGGSVKVSKAAGVSLRATDGTEDTAEANSEEPLMEGEESTEEGVIDFALHGIDMSGFPFGVWKRITRNVLTEGDGELFAQGQPQGDYDLRLTISRYLHSSRSVNCTPDQIIVGAGNDYLLLLLEKLLGRHVPIAMENPTYRRAYRLFDSFAYPIHLVDMDDKGMRADQLEKSDARVAYVMPSHQFPTGALMPIGRRSSLLAWADREPGRYLIEDDYDSEFRYRGKPMPSLQSSDTQGRVIYIGTFSKAIAPAIRISYIVLPKDLLMKYRQDCGFYSCTVPRMDQRVLNTFIRDGYFERHLNKMRKLYRTKHDVLVAGLSPFLNRFRIVGADAGLHLSLVARDEENEEELLKRAREAGVRVYGLSEHYVKGAPGHATILIGFGSLTEAEIKEGLRRLAKSWDIER